MKKSAALILVFALYTSVASQTFLDDLNEIKKIRPLESDADEVVRLLGKNDVGPFQDAPFHFSLTASSVRIEYSGDGCKEEPDSPFIDASDWDVEKGRVAKIELTPWDDIELKDLPIDTKRFRSERLYRSHKNVRILYDKDEGIAIEVHGGAVRDIYLYPSRKYASRLCKNESTRKFFLSNKWRRYPEEKHAIVDFNSFAHVTDLSLTAIENEERKFRVRVSAKDAENDVLTYVYGVSGGTILGSGADVVWDLSSAAPGTYTITAGVDDGCGICGKTQTKSVTIK